MRKRCHHLESKYSQFHSCPPGSSISNWERKSSPEGGPPSSSHQEQNASAGSNPRLAPIKIWVNPNWRLQHRRHGLQMRRGSRFPNLSNQAHSNSRSAHSACRTHLFPRARPFGLFKFLKPRPNASKTRRTRHGQNHGHECASYALFLSLTPSEFPPEKSRRSSSNAIPPPVLDSVA